MIIDCINRIVLKIWRLEYNLSEPENFSHTGELKASAVCLRDSQENEIARELFIYVKQYALEELERAKKHEHYMLNGGL